MDFEYEDACIPVVERVLDRSATRHSPGEDKPVATDAVWFCACVGDEWARWLIYRALGGRVFWHAVSDDAGPTDPSTFIRAPRIAGGHVSPSEVLRWLQGEDDPWGGASHFVGDADLLRGWRDGIHAE